MWLCLKTMGLDKKPLKNIETDPILCDILGSDSRKSY